MDNDDVSDPGEALSVSRDGDVELSTDRVFGLLVDDRCRRLLRELRGAGTLHRGEVARRLVDVEPSSGDAPSAVDLETLLHHRYLPRLEDAGVVDYDRDDGRIGYRGNWLLETLLDRIDDLDRS